MLGYPARMSTGELTVRRIAAGAVELAVLEAGAGGAPLLLLHGFTGAKEDFAEALPGLAAGGWHAVAPDLRGHGDSDAPPEESDYTLDSFAADVVALADALGWARFTLLGHSMGGMIAQVVAVGHPDRLHALVLMNTTHGPIGGVSLDVAELAADVARTQGLEVLHQLIESLGGGPLASGPDERLKAERPGYAEYGKRKLLASSPAMYASMAPGMAEQADRLDALSSVDVPTLVIVGEHDKAMLRPSRRLAEAMPSARLAVVPDAAHSPQFESTDAWTTVLHQFLSDVQP